MLKKRMAELFDRSFWSVALPLIIPIALQNLLMTSFRLVDTLMVGWPRCSIAAVGLAGWASFFVELLAFGMSSGAAVFVAQYHGANNKEGILRTYGMMLLFMVPLGLIFTIGVGLYPSFVMGLFTDDPALIAEGVKYLQFACVSYLSLTINLADLCHAALHGAGEDSNGDQRNRGGAQRNPQLHLHLWCVRLARHGRCWRGVSHGDLFADQSDPDDDHLLHEEDHRDRTAEADLRAQRLFQAILEPCTVCAAQ